MKKVFNLYNISLVLILGLISVLTLKTAEVKATGTVTWPNGSTATITRTVQNVYNAPEVDFTYNVSTEDTSILTVKTATFDVGTEVGTKMKDVAEDDDWYNVFNYYDWAESSIVAIKRSQTLPNNFVPTTRNTVSNSTSEYPIYLFFDDTDGTIYYYSEANILYLNSDSSYMFAALESLEDISGLSELNTSNAEEMDYMFLNCINLANINALSNWNTSKVENMASMFSGCSSLTNINGASNWDTSTVTNISDMLMGCSNASGTIQILGVPEYYGYFCYAATATGAEIIVNYGPNTPIDDIIAEKAANSHIVKGIQVSTPSGGSQGGGSSSAGGTVFYTKTISFDGSETVSNSYTVSKSGSIDFSNIGLNFKEPGVYDLTVNEIATINSAYPTTNTEYTVTIQVQNVLDNNIPTGNFTATYVIKDANDNKVNSMSYAHPKDESYFGHIELTKTVKGIMADATKYFDFSIQVDDAASSACSSYTGSEKYPVTGVDTGHFSAAEVTKCKSGTKDSLSIKHGQTAKIGQFTYNNANYDSISIDDYYKIVEANESGYTTSFKVGNGSEASSNQMSITAVSNGTNNVTFYNNKGGNPLTGIIFTILPYLLLVGIGAGGLILFKKKRKTEVI